METDGRSAIEQFDLKPGMWLAGRWYVADVVSGRATLLAQSMHWTREEIEARGQAIRRENRRRRAFQRRLADKQAGKRVDGTDRSGQ